MKTVFIKLWIVLLLIACGGSARADFIFGNPVNLGPTVNSPSDEISTSISTDGLSLYFASNRPGGLGEYDLWVSTRPTPDASWAPPVNLGDKVNSPYSEMDPRVSADGLTLYFSDPHGGMGLGRPRPGGLASGEGGNIWMARRATVHDPWGTPVNGGPALNNAKYVQMVQPYLSADGLSFYVHACDKGIGVARRASLAESFGTPVLLAVPGSQGPNDWWPGISADERALFISIWNWGSMNFHLWVATRSAPNGDFGSLQRLPARINYPGRWVLCPSPSADGTILFFCSRQPGGLGGGDLCQAPILPVVDFNEDKKVDIQDLLRLIESWGKDDPAVDIGPQPWGDGVIDAKDLEILMSRWGQEVPDPALIAHWKLDEVSGLAASDSVGNNPATLLGNPAWQPAAGKVQGALQFDGVDDALVAPYVLDPSKMPFSVFLWVRGGAPGQVLLSQAGGANWLLVSPDGTLMTELMGQGRNSKPLTSPAVVTDDTWHRVAFGWDGSNRILDVDGVEVARDTQANFAASDGDLYLGVGSTLAPGSYWSGLIDDVRIYNRAVQP